MGEEDDDQQLEQDFSDLQDVEDRIKSMNDELEEKMLELDKVYSRKKRPLFEERTKICAKIPNFWLNALLNHRELQNYIATKDHEALRHLTVLDVQEIDEEGYTGTKYTFHFNKNEFFENQVLSKQFKYDTKAGNLDVESSKIKWKEGQDLVEEVQKEQIYVDVSEAQTL